MEFYVGKWANVFILVTLYSPKVVYGIQPHSTIQGHNTILFYQRKMIGRKMSIENAKLIHA